MVRFSSGRCLVLLLALATAPATLVAQQGSGAKLAYMNARAVLLATPGYAQAESTYTGELAGFRSEIERLQASLDSAAADFEQRSVMLSATARTAKRRELEEQRERLQSRATELQQRAAQREQELLTPVHNKVADAVEQIRSEGGYAMIFDVSANAGLIIAVDKSLDVTQRVIEKIKATP